MGNVWKKSVRLLAVCVAIFTALVGGCGRTEQMSGMQEISVQGEENLNQTLEEKNSFTVTFTDDLGREITVEKPERVAALLGSYADIWYLAGGTICASAEDAWEDFELPLPDDAVNLGMTKKLSLESLFLANPDFVLASANTKQNVEWMETLEAAGITTAYFDVTDFEDYLRVLQICTQITGKAEYYEKNGTAILEQIQAVVQRSQERIETEGEAPSVLSLRASATYIRAKNSVGNVLGEMLADLGCVNIADSEESLIENLSMEYIMTADPDYIFICQIGNDLEGMQSNIDTFIAENPAWANLTAVKEGRVYIMDKALYTLKPNDRWGEAYEKLEEIFAQK